jgi:hypothetical protein
VLADGTPCGHVLVARWVRHNTTYSAFMAATYKREMSKFVGLHAWIGLVQFPTIADYWNKSCLCRNEEASYAINRNWFQHLLQVWHFWSRKNVHHMTSWTKFRC